MMLDLFGDVVVLEDEIVDVKIKKPTPFTFVDNIAKKKYPESLYGYSPFIVNLALSQNQSALIFANEMNKYHALGDQEQFDFLFHALPKKNLYAKWAKKTKTAALEDICEYYGVSKTVGMSYAGVLLDDQIAKIKEWNRSSKGGKSIK